MKQLIDAVEDIAYPEDADAPTIAALSQAASLKRIADMMALTAGKPAPAGNPLLRRAAQQITERQAVMREPDADGFNPWGGSIIRPPVDGADEVIVRLRNGEVRKGPAQTFHWLAGSRRTITGPNGEQIAGEDQPTDVVAWKSTPKDPAHVERMQQ